MFVILKILWRFKLSKACSALCLEPATKMLDLSFLLKQGLCWTFQISHLEGDIKRDGLRRQRQHLAEGVWPPARNDLHQKWLFSITVCLKCKAFLEHHKQLDLLSAFFFFLFFDRAETHFCMYDLGPLKSQIFPTLALTEGRALARNSWLVKSKHSRPQELSYRELYCNCS